MAQRIYPLLFLFFVCLGCSGNAAFDIQPAPINDFLYDAEQNTITVYGDLADGCTQFDSISGKRSGNSITIDVFVSRERNRDCIQAMEPFEATYQLDDDLQDGTYSVRVNDLSRDVVVDSP